MISSFEKPKPGARMSAFEAVEGLKKRAMSPAHILHEANTPSKYEAGPSRATKSRRYASPPPGATGFEFLSSPPPPPRPSFGIDVDGDAPSPSSVLLEMNSGRSVLSPSSAGFRGAFECEGDWGLGSSPRGDGFFLELPSFLRDTPLLRNPPKLMEDYDYEREDPDMPPSAFPVKLAMRTSCARPSSAPGTSDGPMERHCFAPIQALRDDGRARSRMASRAEHNSFVPIPPDEDEGDSCSEI